MNFDGRRIGIAGFALVLPGVRGLRCLDKEPGGGFLGALCGYHRDAAPGTIIVQDALVVVPKDVGWWLRAEVYSARQVYRATYVHVHIGATQYRRCRHCNKKRTNSLFSLHWTSGVSSAERNDPQLHEARADELKLVIVAQDHRATRTDAVSDSYSLRPLTDAKF